jgi:integrase
VGEFDLAIGARRLSVVLDKGQDPREVERQQQAEREAKRKQEQNQATTIGEAWAAYLEERQPQWGKRHYADHVKMSKAGGEVAKSGVKRRDNTPTSPGPIYPLLALKLVDLDTSKIDAWATENGETRPTYARLALRCLKAFLGWCADHPAYAALMSNTNPANSKKAKEALGKAGVKDDALLKDQLPAWFAAVRQIKNSTIAAYLQCLLLTGARPGEIIALKWEDVHTKWRGLTIRDKVEGERVIPLTPYVHHLIAALPRRNEFVFTSGREASVRAHNVMRRASRAGDAEVDAFTNVGESGHISSPGRPHANACRVAGIEELTLHGLRRSFSSLTEWLEIPAGVVAQIQGHKPSATAEKHYKRRPLDLLRVHHERIEAWILEQADVTFEPATEPGNLRIVTA